MRLTFVAATTLLAVTLSPGCASRQPGEPVRPGYNVYSPEQDVQIGREAAAEIRKQVEVVDNPRLQNYIAGLGRKLAAQPEAGDFPYSFTLVNDDSINAFALPGGPIFVHTGLVEGAESEAQLAGVLSHEIAHVALRHGTSQASKASIIQLPAVLAGAALGQDSALAQLGQIGLGLGVNSLLLRYSRDAETEADALGARILAGAGYDPLEMARFFEKLEEEGGSRAPQFLSSHPNPGNRVQAVQAEVATFPGRQYQAGSGEFPQIKTVVAQLPPPRRSAQQTTASASAPPSPPSGALQRLEASRFSLSYPEGWKAFGDRRSPVLTLAPQNGLVRNRFGGFSIGYGAVLSYYSPRSGRANLSSATQELIRELQSVNPQLALSGQPRQVGVSGSTGILSVLSGRSPYGGSERNVLLTVARPEGLFYMVFVAPERDFGKLQGTFEQMLQSIRF